MLLSQDLPLEILFPSVQVVHRSTSFTMQLWQFFTIFMVLFANDALGCVKSPKKKGAPCRPSLEGCYACSTNKRLIVSLLICSTSILHRANGLDSSNVATASMSGPRSRIAELRTVSISADRLSAVRRSSSKAGRKFLVSKHRCRQ